MGSYSMYHIEVIPMGTLVWKGAQILYTHLSDYIFQLYKLQGRKNTQGLTQPLTSFGTLSHYCFLTITNRDFTKLDFRCIS